MRSAIWIWFRGGVKVESRSGSQERLLNAMAEAGIEVWDIQQTAAGRLRFELTLSDFFRLRPLLKQTGCRIRVLERSGLPFGLAKLEKRKAFAAGAAICLALMFLFASLVWDVEVTGNERLSRTEVLEAAHKEGIRKLQWRFRLGEPAELSAALERSLDGVSWIGVAIKGTRVTIQVVESVEGDERPLFSPRNLIADTDAVVSRIYTERGRQLVEPNTRVKKGQLLISGLLGDEEYQQAVVAQGEVWGYVWHEASVTVPLVQKQRVYSGRHQHRFYLVLGSRGLKLTGYGQEAYEKSEVVPDRYALEWRGYRLPIGWIKETELEAHFQERALEPDEARAIGLQQARAAVLEGAGADAVIREFKVLRQEREDNRLHLTFWFETEQQIAREQVLVPPGVSGEKLQ